MSNYWLKTKTNVDGIIKELDKCVKYNYIDSFDFLEDYDKGTSHYGVRITSGNYTFKVFCDFDSSGWYPYLFRDVIDNKVILSLHIVFTMNLNRLIVPSKLKFQYIGQSIKDLYFYDILSGKEFKIIGLNEKHNIDDMIIECEKQLKPQL